ncbi:uncharacterized protein PHALS_00691 [Plasmopara halstedii]|uniref:Uncharacterized protein n=1 Tax=Plasmopara halstedii TaxID=4781 RepID=A0A0P1AS67_PLAHL|nr:uncharacterized protein PHALS_00691 [Plasmopara halstedii]CEG44322.1 hypothetical protein PHALS_00691 [Plasmopara halstedii]|eukprot:XP_024580691.1 hypothetical protein PHALS_00691 [Plasmopara halstedii]
MSGLMLLGRNLSLKTTKSSSPSSGIRMLLLILKRDLVIIPSAATTKELQTA